MPWNPEVYDSFKDIRYRPFYDLAVMTQDEPGMKAIDLGCGTGEQTSILAKRFPGIHFTGVDSSPEMLEKSKQLEHDRLHFKLATIEEVIASGERWDLIFSNAALQWTDNHPTLFPNLLNLLNSGGQLALQMPVQPDNALNKLLYEFAEEQPFSNQLQGWNRPSSVLSMDAYAQILFEQNIPDFQLFQKVYPIIADHHDTLYNFISGSALIPYLERLQPEETEVFISKFKERIATCFPKLPAVYAFKRLLMYGRKK